MRFKHLAAALVGVDYRHFAAGLGLMKQGQFLLKKGEKHGIPAGLEAASQPFPAVAQAAHEPPQAAHAHRPAQFAGHAGQQVA
jgi:hypothetical protein